VDLGHGDQQRRKTVRSVKTGNEQMCRCSHLQHVHPITIWQLF